MVGFAPTNQAKIRELVNADALHIDISQLYCDSGNFATDAYLSMAIGGASSFFVGTDVAYLGGEGNFLRPVVGVEDFDSDLLGVAKAGTSTALGFVAFHAPYR